MTGRQAGGANGGGDKQGQKRRNNSGLRRAKCHVWRVTAPPVQRPDIAKDIPMIRLFRFALLGTCLAALPACLDATTQDNSVPYYQQIEERSKYGER